MSTQEHIDRLVAARVQADLMQCDTVLVARTDAEAATLIDSNADPRDQCFILGSTNRALQPLATAIQQAQQAGHAMEDAALLKWEQQAALCTFDAAVCERIELVSPSSRSELLMSEWSRCHRSLSHQQAVEWCETKGLEVYWYSPNHIHLLRCCRRSNVCSCASVSCPTRASLKTDLTQVLG